MWHNQDLQSNSYENPHGDPRCPAMTSPTPEDDTRHDVLSSALQNVLNAITKKTMSALSTRTAKVFGYESSYWNLVRLRAMQNSGAAASLLPFAHDLVASALRRSLCAPSQGSC